MSIKLKHGARLELHIAMGRSRHEKKWKNTSMAWGDLLARVSQTTRTHETIAEYRSMKKDEQDQIKDVGGFVGGYLMQGRRKNGFVKERSLITLDADFAPADFWDDTELLATYAIAAYSTHKHTPEHARLRFLIPLSRPVSPEEYEAVARRIAFEMGIDYFDDTTYEPARLMYWPSTPKDGEYFFKYADLPILDPDDVLKKYPDWKDTSAWPESSRCRGLRKKAAEKQGDPLEKGGLIGAFCRTYTVQEAIANFLTDYYDECNTAGRYTYKGGSTAAGLVIYDDKFAYSNHATDPTSGQLCNAFDLVRIHLFGKEDIEAKEDTPVNKLPSWSKMMDFISKDENVKATIGEEKMREAQAEFGDEFKIETDYSWLKDLSVKKNGDYEATIDNLLIILRNDPSLQAIKGRDVFRDRFTVEGKTPWQRDDHAEYWTDVDDAGLRNYFEKIYKIEAKAKIQDAVALVFEERAYNPVKEFIESETWDGTPRVETVLIDYLGAEDNAYVRAVTRKTLVAAVARVYKPGCKFDYMLTLVGEQGIGKSLLVERLGYRWFNDTVTDIRGKESYETLDGSWLIEMGELAALKKADRESMKNYISKTEDTYRKAYARNVTTSKRHTVFIGTTNETEFLSDDTGNRRYWVVDTDPAKRTKLVWRDLPTGGSAIRQIWAEALTLYKAGEDIMHLTDEERAAAVEQQENHSVEDAMVGVIGEFLETPLPDDWMTKTIIERIQYLSSVEAFRNASGQPRTEVCALEIKRECLAKDENAQGTQAETRQINAALKKLGWVRIEKTSRFGPYGVQRGYRRPNKNKTGGHTK